ncbi:MAG: hypothetical protein GY775_10875 [Candidatus Scalindua sp.]|nr:hypothetical protein [Candidatus Scalindua sp.]
MNIESMNQRAVTGSESAMASLPVNNSKGSEKGSVTQNSQADSVELSKKAVELFRNAVAEAGLGENSDTNKGQDHEQSADSLIDVLA